MQSTSQGQVTDYLDWQSKLSLEDVFSNDEVVTYPSLLNTKTDPDQVPNCQSFSYLHLTSLPEEKNRSVLVVVNGADSVCITPQPYSLRTKINEYGGKPYWYQDRELVFVNQSDQCLYSQHFDGQQFSSPRRISVKPDNTDIYMYSDVHSIGSDLYIAIIEQQQAGVDASLNQMFIGIIDASNPDQPPQRLTESADFYSNLVLDVTTKRVAWVQWAHPNMPWDHTQLFTALLGYNNFIEIQEIIARPDLSGASYCQLFFSNNHKLFFSVDFSDANGADDFWNVYRWCSVDKTSVPVTFSLCEFGYPHWQYGDRRIGQFDVNSIVAVGSEVEQDSLFLIDQETLAVTSVYQDNSVLQSLSANGQGLMLAIECGADKKPQLVSLRKSVDDDQPLSDANYKFDKHVLKSGSAYSYPISKAQSISFATRDGQQAHGFFYAPVSHEHSSQDTDALPPLLVMVHGGPTARAYGYFDIQKQFWLSNGFAILDVNHRGSSGYGRAFRDSLYGDWGKTDANDIIDGISALSERGLIDKTRVCIRGKSAGGYAVLRAVTEYPDTFKAGACYYGIGNLATLAEITHKFEKHYTDRLIDEPYDKAFALTEKSKFYSRSPIYKISQIRSAMIIFQGREDKIVPPAVAHEVVSSLAANHVPYDYVEYADEGHGFRQRENNIDAWSKELAFYRKSLRHSDLI